MTGHPARLDIGRLMVRDSVAAPAAFAGPALHRAVTGRRAEGFEGSGGRQSTMRRVPGGHRPTPEEGPERRAHPGAQGEGAQAFGRAYLEQARLWTSRGCAHEAAE